MPIELIDKIKPKNGGSFPMADACDVEMPDGTRLSDQPVIKAVSALPEDAAEHPNVLYLIVEDDTEAAAEDGGDP